MPYGIARHEWEPVAPQLEETEQGWMLSSTGVQADIQASCLKVSIAEDGSVAFWDSDNNLLRQDLSPAKPGDGWTHQSQLQPEEAIYGLGERSMPLNLRLAKEVTDKGDVTDQAKTFRMWNYDAAGKYDAGADPMYICIPVYLGLHSQGSYLVFYENSFDAQFSFAEQATAAFTGGALRYYVIGGSSVVGGSGGSHPAQLLERYTELTGRAPLPPRWALGYHQSHWGYECPKASGTISGMTRCSKQQQP